MQHVRPTLYDGAAIEAGPDRRGREQTGNAQTTGGLPADGHLSRIATETFDIVLHPLQRQLLVHQAVIAGVAGILEEIRRRSEQPGFDQPTERAQSIVDGHHDDVILGHHDRRVILRTRTADQRAAMNPEKHRQPRMRIRRRGNIDIQEETIFRGSPFNIET